MNLEIMKINYSIAAQSFLVILVLFLGVCDLFAAEEPLKKELKWIIGKNHERILCEVYKITEPNGNIVEAYYKIGEKRPSWYKTIYDHKKETLDKCPAQAEDGWFFILNKQYVTYRKGALTAKEKKQGLKAFKSKVQALAESVIAGLEEEK